jgi:coenzyme F420-0:L-glutamate ligase/coenzyme F420-1:gamma-L-glutamate ligase
VAEPITGVLQILPIAGLPELRPGDDLAELLCAAAPWLRDGDILVVTSKAVSKVEGRLVSTPSELGGREQARQQAITAETARVVAERGATRIVVTHHGWVMAAAGVDASNVARGELALLPLDPDASARTLRQAIADRAGIRVAVVISDTSGRTWRRGVTDNAIGVAGMAAVADLRGLPDTSGVPLEVTEIAVADEVAAAADLVKGKLSGIPAAVLRGLLPLADDGQGSASLRRPVAEDMFALGTRDVVRTRRSPTGFARQPVSIPVLRAAIEAAHRATDIDDCLRLVADLVPAQAWPEIEETATTQAGRLLGQASGVIVPMIPDQDDAESLTRLGMAIGALLIQLHAEGLAASWLSPAELDTLDLDTPIADRLPGPLARGARTHGLVVMGQPDLQIER